MHQPSDTVFQAFQTWQADLIDQTTGNPLLFFRANRNALRLVRRSSGAGHICPRRPATPANSAPART